MPVTMIVRLSSDSASAAIAAIGNASMAADNSNLDFMNFPLRVAIIARLYR
ncbi:hypothetical protein GCM10011393_34810 [Sphingopyxis bauzanensis]|nr:hypothetical protein GCM10011393_34810 [Sphingopyxis bauzanensis]